LLASIPTALAGFVLDDYVASILHSSTVIAVSLIVVGLLFILFENIKTDREKKDPEEIPLWKMLVVGIGQTLALIPGTSRSGITTLTGMMMGLDKYSAFKFSFILGIPVLLGSGLYEIVKSYISSTDQSAITSSLSIVNIVLVVLASFVVGYMSLLLVKRFKKSKWLTLFGIYRITVGILILIFI
jgi:undecaprenyl-diphosphatase